MKRDLSWLVLSLSLFGLVACKEKPAASDTTTQLESESAPKPSRTGARENIDANERAEAKKLRAVKDPVQQEVYSFLAETRQHYNNSNFDELEKIAAELRGKKETFGNGSWKIVQFYSSFECRDEEPPSMWELHEQIHKAWIAAKPESITAKVAYADFLVDYAWQARGSDYADKVTQEGWKLFGERLAAASEVLKEGLKLRDKDPMLGRVFLQVALGQSWPKAVYDTFMQKLHKEEPKFWGYDTARAYSLLPRWHGEPGDWEAFAEETASRTDGLGNEVYARIVMNLRGYYENIFRETKASWPRTREGLEQLRTRYPDCLEFVSASAFLASLANDRELAKQMFDQLGDNYMPSVWRKPERFTHCRNWARTGKW